MIGDATVVALSEGAHCASEPLEFRNRLLEYLVLKKGFTAIAIESGIAESQIIHQFVRGHSGDLDAVATQGITWGLERLPQNRALIQWLRQYNTGSSPRRAVNFYGFDVSGCPAHQRDHFGHDPAIEAALLFLSRVDATASRVFRKRFEPFWTNMRFHPRSVIEGPSYETLGQPERDALTAAIADLIVWLERHEGKYVAASASEDYAWAWRAAIGARQIDGWLRQSPAQWLRPAAQFHADELPSFCFDAMNVRDRAQAENLDWIISRETAEGGKVLVFAARSHLAAASATVSWRPHRQEHRQESAGTYLRRRLGNRLVTIGNLIGQGEVACDDRARHSLGKASEQSLDAIVGEVGIPLFLLDLRRAPAQVSRWLDGEHQLAASSQVLKVAVREAFDILFYVDTVTPACGPSALARGA
jgi:erythromycin esterase